jgi:hypothetical protein
LAENAAKRVSKKALLFEKRSTNFLSIEVRVAAALMPYEQKFFGSFLQKRTAYFPNHSS